MSACPLSALAAPAEPVGFTERDRSVAGTGAIHDQPQGPTQGNGLQALIRPPGARRYGPAPAALTRAT